jgi:hypothetical protein
MEEFRISEKMLYLESQKTENKTSFLYPKKFAFGNYYTRFSENITLAMF